MFIWLEITSYLYGNFPADNPDYVVYVAIDNPKGITQYGGTVAAPVAKNIILSIIDYLDYKPVNNELTRAYTWLDEKYVYLDNVIGLDVKEVKQILKT